jgi:RNase P protein component
VRAERPHALPRSRRLKRRRLVRPLFDRARPDVGRVRVGVVHVVYRRAGAEDVGAAVPLQAGFAPSRTRTKVGRNRVRRALRETFRLHQRALLDALAGHAGTLTLFVIFRGREATAPADIRRDLPVALARLAGRIAAGRNDARPAP